MATVTTEAGLELWQRRVRIRRSRLIGYRAKERYWRRRCELVHDDAARARAEELARVYALKADEVADLYERARRGLERYEDRIERERADRASEHFSLREFDCKDGTRVPAVAEPAVRLLAVRFLEPLRERFGPAIVHSGYRTRSYNASIGGAQLSQHVYDESPQSVAADVSFPSGTPAQWAAAARALPGVGGVGRYDGSRFVHVDSGPRRDWSG